MFILFSLVLSGCCRNEIAPILTTPQLRTVDSDEVWTVPLEDIVVDSNLELDELTVSLQVSNPNVSATLTDGWITVTPNQTPFNGTTILSVTVEDSCETYAIEEFQITFGLGDTSDTGCVKKLLLCCSRQCHRRICCRRFQRLEFQ
jgi:hypothetical protein